MIPQQIIPKDKYHRLTIDRRASPLPTTVRNGTGANLRAWPDTDITNFTP